MELRNFVAEVGSNLQLNSRKVLRAWVNEYALLAERGLSSGWSGRRESNPPSQLGRLEHYHYATPAWVASAALPRFGAGLVEGPGFEPGYGVAEQIYSLPPLTTRTPLRDCRERSTAGSVEKPAIRFERTTC